MMLLTLFIASLFAATADWLTCKGNKIYDLDGKEVWLTGTNWFGFNTGTGVFDGIWSCNMHEALHAIADHGLNLLRIPISVQLLLDYKAGGKTRAQSINSWVNKELVDADGNLPTSFWCFNKAVEWCKEVGMKIMIDIHSAPTDASGHMLPLWYTGSWSTAQFYEALEWFAGYYKNEDTIIAIDLKNEPHGKPTESEMAKWDGSSDINNWRLVAETAGKKCLALNPHLLIMVEGIEVYPTDGKTWSKNAGDYYFTWWGGNLRGVKDYPINLGSGQTQLVYSPHDYGPSVFQQSWFNKTFTMNSLYEDCWRDNWAYIDDQKMHPLLIGEWGGFMDGGANERWMTFLRDFIVQKKIHHTFWCFNANSGDTGGLVQGDFVTWDEAKFALLKPALWQAGGKYVGLSHTVKLGKNGITLSDL